MCPGQLSQRSIEYNILRVVLYQLGKSLNLLFIGWLSHHSAISVLRLVVDAVDGSFMREGLLEIVGGQELPLEQGLEDSEFEHVAECHLGLFGLVVELQFDLIVLEESQVFTLLRRLANQLVEGVEEAEHGLFIADCKVERLTILPYQGDALPGVPTLCLHPFYRLFVEFCLVKLVLAPLHLSMLLEIIR